MNIAKKLTRLPHVATRDLAAFEAQAARDYAELMGLNAAADQRANEFREARDGSRRRASTQAALPSCAG